MTLYVAIFPSVPVGKLQEKRLAINPFGIISVDVTPGAFGFLMP